MYLFVCLCERASPFSPFLTNTSGKTVSFGFPASA